MNQQRNPAADLKQFRATEKAVPCFSREQLRSLLAQPDVRTFTWLRDRTAMLVMMDTAIRVGELLNIRAEDVFFEEGMPVSIRIRDPKNTGSALPISRRCRPEPCIGGWIT